MTAELDVKAAAERCRRYRRRILDISQQVSALHVAPAFSCVEIVDVIYNELMRNDDVFILSKGHAAILQYVILEECGLLAKADLDLYTKAGGRLGAHPDYGTPGIAASTGSLGHGLGIAVGQAYAEKLKGSAVRFFCLLSDGECQEGSTWEAARMAAQLRLDNLVVFVDANGFGGLEAVDLNIEGLFQAFNWGAIGAFHFPTVTDRVDGHNSSDLFHVGARASLHDGPVAIVCKTIKGKGVSYMENAPIWHYRSPTPSEYQQALKELGP